MAFDSKAFLSALEDIERLKGISKETVIEYLKDAMAKGYRRQLGGDDADVRVNLDPEKGILEMFYAKKIVEEVEDDFLEISIEDAKKIDKKYKVGDDYLIPASIEDLKKATAMSIKSILRQKFVEAERELLSEQFKDKANTIITGKVENTDEKGCSVNIGRTTVFLPRKEMIGDEKFNIGDPIKLYVNDVSKNAKGAHIIVSRACEGFLACLMKEEIREIYDETILIKAIAREAGERSKVAVYSKDLNVDPAGACIGPSGTRIQKVVGQLGNGNQKEKIDIVTWSENVPLFIMESLKPARVAGINVDLENKSATAIVKDDSFSLAIGKKGVNARLAVKLTGYKIDVKTESDALEEGIEYTSFEEINAKESEIRAQKLLEQQKETYMASIKSNDVLPGLPTLPEGYVAPQSRVYDDEDDSELTEALEAQADLDTVERSKPVKEETKVEVEETPVIEETVKEEPTPVATQTVKTTTTLEDLEKSLEKSDNKKTSSKKSYKGKAKKEEETKEESTPIKPIEPSTRMSIYTEEELKEMEEEEKNHLDDVEDDDIDYDDYDDYYEDK